MESSDVTLRAATPEDVPAVLELWKEFMEFHSAREASFAMSQDGLERFEEYLRKNMAEEKALVIVAEADGRVVGYGLSIICELAPVFKRRLCGRILDLAVTERFRRRGVGGMLFREAKKWFESNGIDRIETTVAAANEVSTAFWREKGFKPFTSRLYRDI